MPRFDEATLAEIRAALAGKRGPEAKATIQEIRMHFGCSLGYLYRLTASVRNTARARRKDNGQRRIILAPEIEDFMEALTKQGDLAADHVLWITARHFGLSSEFMSPVTYNVWLRRKRQSRDDLHRDLRPYRSFEAAKPNDMHHYDTTVAEAYYSNDDGSIGYEPGFKRYKNKPGNKRPRLILYSLVDDHSRVLFARFYLSENTFNLLDFIFHCWSQKDDKRFPAYGIPAALYADKGSPQRSEKFRRAMAKISVTLPDSTPSHAEPHGSRKHGKVERTFGEGLLGEFMKLTLVYRFASLEELNATLWDWLIHINNKLHSVTREVRFARWLNHVGTPRHMPAEDLFSLLVYSRAERVVTGNLQLSLNGKTYQLPYRKPFINWVGAKVEVYWYPGKDDTISVVYDHHEEEIKALAPVIDLALEYKSVAKTDREERLEQLSQVNFSRVNIPAIYNSNLPYLPKKGEKFDDSKIAEKTITTAESKQRPSFAPKLYLGRSRVAQEFIHAGIITPGENDELSDPDIKFLKLFMAGRSEVDDDEVQAAKKRGRAQLRHSEEGKNE